MYKTILKSLLLISLFTCLFSCGNKHERANKYVESAQMAYEKGDFQSAKIEFNNALSAESDRVDALFGLAQILEKEKKWPQYHNFLKRILELDPKHQESILKFATLKLASGDIKKALELSDQLLDISPEKTTTWVLKASVQAKLDDRDGSKQALEKALEINPKDDEALLLLANIHMAEGAYDNAITTLDQGINQHTSNAYFYAVKIRALNKLGKTDQTIDTFQNLIELNPSNPAVYNVLAKQYIELNKIDLARKTLTDFAENHPSQEAVFNVISFYEEFNTPNETEAVLTQYLNAYPRLFSLNFLLSDFYLRNKQFNKSRDSLTQAIDNAPDTQKKLLAKNQIAVLELALEDFEQVEKITQEILQEDAKNFRAITLKARAQLAQGKVEPSIRLLRSVLSDDSENAFVLFLLGKAHQQQGIIELANDHYQKSVLLSNYHPDMSTGYAEFLLSSNRLSQAEEVLEKTPLLSNSADKTLELLANTKLRLGKWSEAEKIAQEIEKIDGSKARSAQIMGLVYSGQNDMQQSIDAFQTAYKESSQNLKPLLALVGSYLKANRINDAKDFLKKILLSDPDNIHAFLLQGSVYTYTKEYDKAEVSLKKAVSLHPTHANAHTSLHDFYRRTGDIDKAENSLNKALAQLPTNLTLTIKLASLKSHQGDDATAQKLYENWLTHSPKTSIVRNNLASLLLKSENSQDHQQAIELAQALSESKIPHFLDTLGWAYFKTGKYQSALKYLEQASINLKGVPEFDYHLGMTYIALSRSTEGKTLLLKAVETAKPEAHWLEDAKVALGTT